jgi:tripeptidyl-peptidase I
VKGWLLDSGIAPGRIKLSQGLNWLQVNTTISEVQRLLKTEYFTYEHVVTGQPQIACHEYYLPPHIAKYVDFITPTVHFDTPLNIKHRRSLTKPSTGQKRPREVRKRDVRTLSDAYKAKQIQGSEEIARERPGIASEIGTSLGSLPKQGATLADDEGISMLEECDQQITPLCLRSLYGFNESTEAHPDNSFGFVLSSIMPF